jgi:BMFP domain-containing protein YqiC
MTQTTNRLLDELAKLMTDAAGAAQGMRREVESVMRAQAERILQSMDIVGREEFEAVKAMAEKARAENERLSDLVATLASRTTTLEAELQRQKGGA